MQSEKGSQFCLGNYSDWAQLAFSKFGHSFGCSPPILKYEISYVEPGTLKLQAVSELGRHKNEPKKIKYISLGARYLARASRLRLSLPLGARAV